MDKKYLEKSLDHAMKHFEIHAAQRLTAFNFFIVISGAISALILTSIQDPQKYGYLGVFLGVLLVGLSAIFWKLDRRTKFLIKHSEAAIKLFEKNHLEEGYRVFTNEEMATDKDRGDKVFFCRMFSYSEVFGLLFIGSAILGASGAILSFAVQQGYASSVANDMQNEAEIEAAEKTDGNNLKKKIIPALADPSSQTETVAPNDAKRQQNGS